MIHLLIYIILIAVMFGLVYMAIQKIPGAAQFAWVLWVFVILVVLVIILNEVGDIPFPRLR